MNEWEKGILCTVFKIHFLQLTGPIRGGSVSTLVRGPDSQEGTCESLKGPIALAIDVLFWFFHIFLYIYNYENLPVFLLYLKSSIWREKSQPVPGTPNQTRSALHNFSELGDLAVDVDFSNNMLLFYNFDNFMRFHVHGGFKSSKFGEGN